MASDRVEESVAAADGGLGYRPLYRRVKDMLVKRIADGAWTPGQLLPSEFQIAQDLAVSQGTVRKALDEMTAENMLVRRQGKGTFVARHDEARILFQYFKLQRDDGEKAFPESEVVEVATVAATAEVAAVLGLAAGDAVIRVRRVRSLDREPVIAETIHLPAVLFPGLADEPVPNNLYGLYSTRYGVTVARARERLKAVAAAPEDARLLGVAAGTPVLAIDRVAEAIDGATVEWRVSVCRTERYHYISDLR
jgi:GntR family transcriptional regulator